jgi:twinkle protein
MLPSLLNGSLESEFVRHEPCENCGSSDGKSLYSDGHTFCFVCHHYVHGDGTVKHNTMTTHVQLQGSAGRLQKRGISEQTCEKFKCYRDGEKLRFYYFSSDGALQGAKVKGKDKTFTCEGKVNSLYGIQLFRHKTTNKQKKIVITEGEMDCLSVWEAQPNWDVVSIPNGAQSAKKAIQNNYEWLNHYDKIVLFFDNDSAGRKAAEDCAGVLPPGKVYIGHTEDYKDASEALQAGDSEAIRAVCNFDHQLYRPDGIVDGKTLLDLVSQPSKPCDHEYPFTGLQKLTHGVRYGELITITAATGAGKSSFCRELCTHFLQNGERVGYLALEESNRRTALGLMSSAVSKPLHIGEHDYNRIEYLASGLDCRIVFLDHLSILLSGLEGEERRMIDQTMTKLRSLVERTGIALFLVSHLRRTQTDHAHEEGARVTIGQLRGSASIAQLSDGVIALERDQQSGSEHSTTTVRVLKNRYSGETGVAGQLTYDLDTCKFTEHEAQPDFNPATDF